MSGVKNFLFAIIGALLLTNINGQGTPTVIWHGMGDHAGSLGLDHLQALIEENTPEDTYVFVLATGVSGIADIISGFIGNANEQVQDVCDYIAGDSHFANGYHAVGLSQGGQFLRAVAQRCPDPPMKNLISLGGQHQGVFGFPGCDPTDGVACDTLRHDLSALAYMDVFQNTIIQAQYWHDSTIEETYQNASIFIAEINNDKAEKNETYATNLASLENFVMVQFDGETTVFPKESEHFAFYAPGSGTEVLPLQESDIYIEDRIGLKTMDEQGKLVFMNLPGNHLDFTDEWFVDEIVLPYLQ